MNVQSTISTTAFLGDEELFQRTHTHTNTELLVAAARMSGKSPFELGRDYMRQSRNGRGIALADYVRYKLWDTELHGIDGAARFIGAKMHWPVVNKVNSPHWYRVAEDKLVMSAMLTSAGLSHPETVAFVDTGARSYPALPKITNADDLCNVVTAYPDGTLFLKTVGGMIGQGAIVIEAADTQGIKCTGRDTLGYDEFLKTVIGDVPYLIQKRLDNHSDIAPYLSGLATIRFPNFMREHDHFNPCVVMKLPSGGNVTCAYWRPGNLAAEIELESGRIVRIAHRNGPVSESRADHPERSGLMGKQLPFWKEACELNAAAAQLFGSISYNSTDIALTSQGPILVEVNYGGSFDVLQNSTGRGILTAETKDWLQARGVDFSRTGRKLRFR